MTGARAGLALLAGLLTGAALIGGAVVLKRRPAAGTPGAPVVQPGDTGAPCAPDDTPVPPLLPEAESTQVRFIRLDGVRLRVDGTEVTQATLQLKPGRHRLIASTDQRGVQPMNFVFDLQAFTPAWFDVAIDGPAVTVLPLGASCADCRNIVGDVTLESPSPREPAAALDTAALAIAATDWAKARDTLAQTSATTRRTPRFQRQWAQVQALSGHSFAARDLVLAQKLKRVTEWLDVDEASELTREKSVLIDRWNELTERYSRLTSAFSLKAPGPTEQASARFQKLSDAFTAAAHDGRITDQRQLLTAGLEALSELVNALRASLGTQCLEQRDITRLSGPTRAP